MARSRLVLTEDELTLLMSEWTTTFGTFMEAVEAALDYLRACKAAGILPGNAAEGVLLAEAGGDGATI